MLQLKPTDLESKPATLGTTWHDQRQATKKSTNTSNSAEETKLNIDIPSDNQTWQRKSQIS